MKRVTGSLVMGVLLAILVTWSMNWVHPDRAPYYRNARVLNSSGVQGMAVQGPVQPGFTLTQPIDLKKLHVPKNAYLELPVCVVLFLDKSYPTFQAAPLQIGLRNGELERTTTIDSGSVINRFMRICLPGSRLSEFNSGSPEIVIRAPESGKTNVVKIILTRKEGAIPAVVNGKVDDRTLPFSLEVHREMSADVHAKNFLFALFPCLMLTLMFGCLPWRTSSGPDPYGS